MPLRSEVEEENIPDEIAHERNVQQGTQYDRVGNVKQHADWSKDLQPDVLENGKKQFKALYGKGALAAWLSKKNAKFAAFDKWDSRFFVLHGSTLRYYKSREDAQEHSAWLEEQVSA